MRHMFEIVVSLDTPVDVSSTQKKPKGNPNKTIHSYTPKLKLMTDEKYRGVIIDDNKSMVSRPYSKSRIDPQLKLNGASAMNADLPEVAGGGTAESIVMWQSP